MNEFMLYIRNIGKHQDAWPADKHQQFLKACEAYIADLKQRGQLIAAQPLIREGKVISGTPEAFKEQTLDKSQAIQVGYYHIRAKDFDEAVAIAKQNPEFSYSTTASIEVRPVKMKESTTGFVYPK